jgi:uncharacterized protein (DUF983 family)
MPRLLILRPVAEPDEANACPRCGAGAARLSLLTSMTRYFECGPCGRRWHHSRAPELSAASPRLSRPTPFEP